MSSKTKIEWTDMSKGGDIQEFPLPIQVREFPKTLATT